MRICDIGDITLQCRKDGDPDGAPVVFAHAPGTDLRLWDKVGPLLPRGLHLLRYDLRGQGLGDATPAPCAMGRLIRDAGRLPDARNATACVVVGPSLGGLIAQELAVKRPGVPSRDHRNRTSGPFRAVARKPAGKPSAPPAFRRATI